MSCEHLASVISKQQDLTDKIGKLEKRIKSLEQESEKRAKPLEFEDEEARRAQILADRDRVARQMLYIGGSFVVSLARALLCADDDNVVRIHDAFTNLWDRYANESGYARYSSREEGDL